MAHALQIDTLAFTKKLREAGAEEGLAEAIVEGLTAADTSELATKADVSAAKAELKTEIAKVESKIAVVISDVHWIKVIGGAILVVLVLPWIAKIAEPFFN